MARHTRPPGFRGGIARWVAPDDVRDVGNRIAALGSVDELAHWAEADERGEIPGMRDVAALIAYHCRLGDITEPIDHGALTARLIAALAGGRREAAIRQHVQAHRLDPYVAFGGDGSGRSLLRCPSCDGPIQAMLSPGNLYCCARPECRVAQVGEVAELLGQVE